MGFHKAGAVTIQFPSALFSLATTGLVAFYVGINGGNRGDQKLLSVRCLGAGKLF